jgi:predicted aspartyl protease
MSKHAAFKHDYDWLSRQLLSNIEIVSLENQSKRGVYIGVWDTGAAHTMITPKILSDLELTTVDTVTVHGVNSSAQAPIVLINLILPNGIQVNEVRAIVSKIEGVDLLIGMDLIQMGDFSISNHDGKTVFTFAIPPFQNRTDLYEKAIAISKRKK